jgi:hypothetical protein
MVGGFSDKICHFLQTRNFGIFFVTANSTNSAITFSILESWKKESLAHP